MAVLKGLFLADYYPLIAKAMAGLPEASGESRRAFYERARAALVAQLQTVSPPLSESEITRERLSLEEAIRKVEAEMVARERDFENSAVSKLLEKKLEERRLQLLRAQQVEKKRLAEEFNAIRAQDDARRQRQNEEAERIQNDIRRRKTRAELAKVASPAPELASDGRLDVGPNPIYDEASATEDLPTLPIRQRATIRGIVSGLPGNAPRYLKTSLEIYDEELKVRGLQPILGLLKDAFEIIKATLEDPNARREWLEPGLQKAFQVLAENHQTLVNHFPLDPEREDSYARTDVDEDYAVGRSLSEPFETVAEAAQHANRAGLTTEDFLRVIDKMAEFAKVISTLSPLARSGVDPSVATADQSKKPITARKRIVLSGFGFFERAYNLLGSTATLAGSAEGVALLTALGSALSSLSRLLGL